MYEQTGKTVRFHAHYVASGLSATGLTVTVDVYDPSGTKIINNVGTTEIAGGWYRYTLADSAVTTAGTYLAVFKTAGTADVKHQSDRAEIGMTWLQNLDVATSTRGTLTAAGVWAYGTRELTNLTAIVTAIWAAASRTLTAFGFGVTVTSNSDKTGYKLASDGLDSIATSDPGGVSSMTTLPKKITALWRYFFKKTDSTPAGIHTYADNGTTVNTTMTVSDDGVTQTKNAAT